MNKKKSKKLMLSREVLRHLDPDNLTGVVGGTRSSSENCSIDCTGGGSAAHRTFCICPMCPDDTADCTGTGPIPTGPFAC